jgi:NADH dehydrogenase/NADH:ubiquinone oxidoreductase subunit G
LEDPFFLTLFEKKGSLFIELLIKNTSLIKNNWKGVNFICQNASDIGKLELGIKKNFLNYKNINLKLIYSIGESSLKRFSKTVFVIYQGFQGNSTASFSNIVLPGLAFTEKNAIFVNIEGYYQKTKAVFLTSGKTKQDWHIIFVLIEKLLHLKKVVALDLKKELFNLLFSITSFSRLSKLNLDKQSFLPTSKAIIKNSFLPSAKLENFYRADNVSKLSRIMAKATKNLLEKKPFVLRR